MRYPSSLDALLPKTRQGILAAVLVRPDKTWYASELARRMGVTPSSLQRELRDLTRAGILKSHRQGHMTYYQANRESPLFEDLRGLLLKTAGLVDVLADALKPVAAKIMWAFVYGSIARSQEDSASDVDLMIVGAVGLADLAPALRRAERSLRRPVNPVVYSIDEFQRKVRSHDHFLSTVLKGMKQFVKGNDHDLETIAG